MGSSSLTWLNHATHFSVASFTVSRVLHGHAGESALPCTARGGLSRRVVLEISLAVHGGLGTRCGASDGGVSATESQPNNFAKSSARRWV